MRFGLFYEQQLPRPWEEGAEAALLSQALEQVELADARGLDFVWAVEHHFLEEYSHSSAPEIFLAAASQRTRRIRLGHGIVQLPPGVNHPARVAERVATLDLVSGGRVEFGVGEGASDPELEGFGVARGEKREQWDEALDVVVRMMTETPFAGHRGRHVSVPARNVVPKPLQRPHPPLWMAAARPEAMVEAARRGLGALHFAPAPPAETKAWVDAYYGTIASDRCVPKGLAVNANVAVCVPFMCHEDAAAAAARGLEGAEFFSYALSRYYGPGAAPAPGRADLWEEFRRHPARGEFLRRSGFPLDAIGTPRQVAGLAAAYEEAGVDQLIFIAQAGRSRHEHVCESIELFAREVLPRFAEGAAEREARKRERLAEACEAALARRRSAAG